VSYCHALLHIAQSLVTHAANNTGQDNAHFATQNGLLALADNCVGRARELCLTAEQSQEQQAPPDPASDTTAGLSDVPVPPEQGNQNLTLPASVAPPVKLKQDLDAVQTSPARSVAVSPSYNANVPLISISPLTSNLKYYQHYLWQSQEQLQLMKTSPQSVSSKKDLGVMRRVLEDIQIYQGHLDEIHRSLANSKKREHLLQWNLETIAAQICHIDADLWRAVHVGPDVIGSIWRFYGELDFVFICSDKVLYSAVGQSPKIKAVRRALRLHATR
jgi:hypothetical protein